MDRKSEEDAEAPRKKIRQSPSRSVPEELSADICIPNVVWREVSRYLSYDDLKACRLVSRAFESNVFLEFNRRSVINFTAERLTSASSMELWPREWKDVSVEMDVNSVAHMTWLTSCMERMQTLQVLVEKEVYEAAEEVRAAFQVLLSTSKNLYKLTLNAPLIGTFTTDILRDIDTGAKTLSELELIFDWPNIECCGCRSPDPEGVIEDPPPPPPVPFVATNLTNLRLLEVKLPHYCLFGLEDAQEMVKSIYGLIESNREHLHTLRLVSNAFWSSSRPLTFGASGEIYPALKSLRLWAPGGNRKEPMESLAPLVWMLETHPQLEAFELEIGGCVSESYFEVLKRNSRHLKKLHLDIPHKPSEEGEENWAFLKSTKLEDLAITCKQDVTPNQITALISRTPPTLRRLFLKRFRVPEGVDEQLSLAGLNPLLLTSLSLDRCVRLITDNTVEYICRNFHNLRQLNLSGASPRVTDYGFTGLRDVDDEGPPEFCISKLTGLRSLILHGCFGLSDRTLIQGIRFNGLRYLDLSLNDQFSVQAIRKMIFQNPRLQTFRLIPWRSSGHGPSPLSVNARELRMEDLRLDTVQREFAFKLITKPKAKLIPRRRLIFYTDNN